jgi:hypothetical protein
VNVNQANVQDIANAEIREHSDDTLDEGVTKSCSNAGEKPNDIAVIRKPCKSMSDDEKLDKLQNVCVPHRNSNTASENFKR